MLDIQFIRDNSEKVKKAVEAKNDDIGVVDRIIDVDKKRRELMVSVEGLRATRNKLTKDDIEEAKKLKIELKEKEESLKTISEEFKNLLYKVPNVFSDDTPIGKDESENKVIRKWGEPTKFDFEPKDHLEIGKTLGIIDVETAVKVTAARFTYLKGDAVLMQNALYQFAISVLTDEKILKGISQKIDKDCPNKAFIPVVPPLMINPEVYTKMARLSPETEIERYSISRDELYLVGSAEHTLGPMLMDQTINKKELPIRFFAFTPAFRREAGSYGKDMKGILRLHQFDKIEMESFTTPEMGMHEQDFFVGIQEYLMQSLEIPYQVVSICSGDMGGPDYRQFDIESWVPAQNKYRETHTSDFMTDYQSRRLQTKVRLANGETKYVYMNDATVFAIGRTMIAILENFQQKDGSVLIPKVLQKWMGKEKITGNVQK